MLEPLTVPFRIVIDTREQFPYSFTGIEGDAKEKRRPLVIPTVVATLQSGDYAIDGFATEIAVERKSKIDLFGTLGNGRDRFVRELERLQEMTYAAVMVEADWEAVMKVPPLHSNLNPKTVYRSVIAWQQRFPRIHWWFVPDRRFAEITTFRILQRFFKENRDE